MKSDVIDQQLESSVTRRRVIGTGVKLAYAAPVVAASFKLNSAAAQGASPTCTPTTCGERITCNGSASCYCRTVDGVTRCLQDRLCVNSAICDAANPCAGGGHCIAAGANGNCCDDGLSHCAYPCGTSADDGDAIQGFGVATDSDRMFG
jgi:hypothetical protein